MKLQKYLQDLVKINGATASSPKVLLNVFLGLCAVMFKLVLSQGGNLSVVSTDDVSRFVGKALGSKFVESSVNTYATFIPSELYVDVLKNLLLVYSVPSINLDQDALVLLGMYIEKAFVDGFIVPCRLLFGKVSQENLENINTVYMNSHSGLYTSALDVLL